MAPHSSTLAWKIPWTEEPGRLQSMGSLRAGHEEKQHILIDIPSPTPSPLHPVSRPFISQVSKFIFFYEPLASKAVLSWPLP